MSVHKFLLTEIYLNRSIWPIWYGICQNSRIDIFSKDPYASKNILLYLVQKIICFSPLYLGLAPTFPHFFTMTDFDDILPQKQSETETNEF